MIFSAKLSRYLIVITAIIVVSMVLPYFYSMLFYNLYPVPRVYFSPISKDFIFTKAGTKDMLRYDRNGKTYTREEFERVTPLFNYRQLLYREEMPDSLNGVNLDIQDVKLNNVFYAIKPYDIFKYTITLNPLIESAPGRPDLQMPREFFRIGEKMEFIDCSTNEVKSEMSNLFNNALIESGFVFPAIGVYGNPSTRKPFDEGYLVIDSNDKLFHIKRIQNKPFVRKVEIPEGIKIDYIYLRESNLREQYALFITDKNKIFIISYDNYKIIEIPSEGYDRKEMQLVIKGNMFYREIGFVSDKIVKSIVTDRNYKVIDTYSEILKTNEDYLVGDISNYLFPFKLSLTSSDNLYVDFYTRISDLRFLIVSSILALFYFVFSKKRENKFQYTQLLDAVIILFTGIYGLIAVVLIKLES